MGQQIIINILTYAIDILTIMLQYPAVVEQVMVFARFLFTKK